MTTFLEKILLARRRRIAAAKSLPGAADIRDRAISRRSDSERNALSKALRTSNRLNIIAEIKRASPSKGIINGRLDIAETARSYESGGACCISVLTEEDFFEGSMEDLRAVRRSVSLPVLRKDFILDEFQIFEAAEAGADAVLLIVAALSASDLKRLFQVAQEDLGLDALVEVHNSEELKIAEQTGCRLIGVNNRNLRTFEVSLDVSRNLIAEKPESSLMIAESGLGSLSEISELRSRGFDGFLIGETLMRSNDPRKTLEAWI